MGINTHTHTAATKKNVEDLKIDDRLTKFQEQLNNEHVYRITLRYFTDLDKINFPTKIEYRIKLNLKQR